MKYDAVIFDRDDTLTVDVGWTHRLEDFKFVPGAVKSISKCNELGLHTFIATNQGGIGKGLYTVQQMHKFHWKLKLELSKYNAWIDDIVFCEHYPYPPNDARSCICRKPNPGLIVEICKRWDLIPSRVLMIGDKQTDVDAARRAGASGVLFEGNNLMDCLSSALKFDDC